ncbi:MAG: Ran-binding zinc finger domain-containing protein [Bacteroidota bacterium]
MGTYVGRWDCPTCGNKGILGPETRCPNCGASRPQNVRFYLPEGAAEVTDEIQLQESQAGVDWICGHCNSQNKAKDTVCFSCGNPRDESSQDVNLEERTYHTNEVPTESFKPQRTQHPLEEARRKPPRRRNPMRGILIVMALLAGGFFFLRTVPKTIDVTVTSFSWERSIALEHKEPAAQESWDLPQGAFDVRKSREIRSYKQVLRGYETRTRQKKVQTGTRRYVCGKVDKGNGYFVDKYCTEPVYEYREETYQAPVYDQVPIYDTKYYYKIMAWVRKGDLQEAQQDHNPYWPQNPHRSDSKWREHSRREVYYVVVQEDNGETHDEKMDYNRWQSLDYGSKLKAKQSYLFNWYYGIE